MRKRLILAIVIIVILGAAGYLYVNNVLLPVQLKGFILNKGQELLHRKITFRSIEYNFPHGIVIEGLKIYDKDEQKPPLLEIDTVTLKIFLSALLKKQIVIPSLTIYKPIVHLERLEKNLWNFSDISNRPQTAVTTNKAGPSIILWALNLTGGELLLSDKSKEKEFSESITEINLRSKISFDKTVDLSLSAIIPRYHTYADMHGKYQIKNRKFTGTTSIGNLPLGEYFQEFNTNPNIQLKTGLLTQADLVVEYENSGLALKGKIGLKNADYAFAGKEIAAAEINISDANVLWKEKRLTGKAVINMAAADFTFPAHKAFKGDIFLNATKFQLGPAASADPAPEESKTNSLPFSIEGSINVQNGHFAFDEQKNIQGNLTGNKLIFSSEKNKAALSGAMTVNKVIFSDNAKQTQLLSGSLTFTNMNTSFADPVFNLDCLLEASNLNFTTPLWTVNAQEIKPTKLVLDYARPRVSASVEGELLNSVIQLNSKRMTLPQPVFKISYTFDPGTEPQYQYSGEMTVADASASGLPKIDEAANISGKLSFETNSIRSEQLTLNIKNTILALSGSVNNFIQPLLDFRASSEHVDLATLSSLFPEYMSKTNITLSGEASAQLNFKGTLSSLSAADYKLDAQFNNATVSHKNFPDNITNVTGKLEVTKGLLKWENLKGSYKDKDYSLNGSLADFGRPVVESTLSGKDLSVSATFNILRDVLQATSISGQFLNSGFNAKADIFFNTPDGPKVDLRGSASVFLDNIVSFVPSFKDKLAPLKLKGELTTDILLQGNINNWRKWTLVVKARAPKISVLDNPFDDVHLDFEQRDNYINKFNITSKIYGGDLTVLSSVNLAEPEAPLQATIGLGHLSLTALRDQRKLQNKDLAGDLSASAKLTGGLKDINSLDGEGSFTINDGNLWEWNILEGLWGALLIPEFKNVVFTNATAGFSIRGNKVLTENAELISSTVKLSAKGWIDFDKNINFIVSPTFSEIARLQSDSILQKGPSGLLTQIIHIKLTGTLEKPQYKVESSALKVLEKTGDVLKEGLKGIIEEIWK